MKRALIIRFSSLGDVILTLPAARSLKEAFPAAEVVYLTKAAYRPLLAGQPGIDRVAAIEEAGRGVPAVARYCRGLGRFEVALDLHRTLRSRACLRAARADRKLAYRKAAILRRLWAAGWMRGRMAGAQPHVIDRYLEPLRRVGVAPAYTIPELRVDPEEVAAAGEQLVAAGVRDPDRFLALVPGARWPNKCWPAAAFAAVATGLREAGDLEPVIVGDAADRGAAEALRALIRGGAASLVGGTALPRLAAVLQRARIVIANDSGPAHLAAAVGTPVVALFGPTHEAFGFAPRGANVRVVSRDLPCRPCSVHGGTRCPRGRRACLEDIAPAEVLAAARDVIREGDESPRPPVAKEGPRGFRSRGR